VLLGCLYFAECTAALVGLETISASRSAFLVSLNVIFVPMLSVVLGQRISSRILAAAGLAIVGIGIMSWEGGGFGYGDVLTLACAIGVAIYILTLEVITPRHPTLPLVAIQLLTMAVLSLIWAGPTLLGEVGAIATHANALLYLGLVVTATPIWTQALAQRWVASYEAALLYTLEPVFAALFSLWLLGETLGLRGLLGAGLILMAMTLSQKGE
jgi:drug/metabolite transporter (DMT)-like permease